jgi:hypothetical protein
MKRTAGVLMLLASLGGGCMNTDKQANAPGKFGQAAPASAPGKFGREPQARKAVNYQGPYGEPIARGAMPGGVSPGMAPAGFVTGNAPKAGTDLVQAGFLNNAPGCTNCGEDEGAVGGPGVGVGGRGHPALNALIAGGPTAGDPNAQRFMVGHGILPVPQQGPPGAVAAVGALPAYAPAPPTGMRTSIRFGDPVGMRITWLGPNGWNDPALLSPARYNFLQGGVYRLKITGVPDRVETVYYPTLEVLPAQQKTLAYLAHSSVPVTFTPEDFEQVDAGNFLVKVIYLPDPYYQDLAVVVGPNELVSTRLEPGVDPIVEAQKRGTILAIVRLGNIDLQAPNTPAMDSTVGGRPALVPVPAAPKVIPVPPSVPEKIEKLPAPPFKDEKPKELPKVIDE